MSVGLPALLGAAGSSSPLLQNLVITREELTSLAATLGLPASPAALLGQTPEAALFQSLAQTKAEVEAALVAGFCPGEAGPPAFCSCPPAARRIPWPGKEL